MSCAARVSSIVWRYFQMARERQGNGCRNQSPNKPCPRDSYRDDKTGNMLVMRRKGTNKIDAGGRVAEMSAP
jgi:hypothetical protein